MILLNCMHMLLKIIISKQTTKIIILNAFKSYQKIYLVEEGRKLGIDNFLVGNEIFCRKSRSKLIGPK